MSGLHGRRTTQQDRLAQLSDDNAFVDVEAALRRMGQDVTLDITAQQLQRSVKPTTVYDAAAGTAGVVKGSGGRGTGRKVTRPSEEALLNGARVPLTASLQEQHRAYMESVRAAAQAVEALSGSSSSRSSSSSSERGSAIRPDGGDDVGELRDPTSATAVRRARSKTAGPSCKGGAAPTPRRGRQPKNAQGTPLVAVPLAVPVVAVSVRAVKTEPAGETAVTFPQKRAREDVSPQAVKQEAPSATTAATPHHLQECTPQHCEDMMSDLSVPASLVAQLTSELRLVEQWRRVVLDHPPCIINNVLSPEPRAPWGAMSATAGTAQTARDVGSLHLEEPELPYPLLQLYTVCPSYEALAAAPVQRRCLERVWCDAKEVEEENEKAAVPLSSLAAIVADGLRTSSRAVPRPLRRRVSRRGSAAQTAAAVETVTVAGVCFDLSSSSGHTRRKGDSAARARGKGEVKEDRGAAPSAPVQGTHQHHLCSVCMLPASYRCLRCRTALFCSVECHVVHDATRCLKFTV